MGVVAAPPKAFLVLVVDDDEALRRLLEAALVARGYRFTGAANGREALEQVAAEVPSLIVLDFWMPILDGAGFMHELPQHLAPGTKKPPVILFTAIHDDPRLGRDLGVDVYVEKPVDLHRFLRLVDATMRAGRPRTVDLPPLERRQVRRVPVRRPVEVHIDGRAAPAFTIDLSEEGTAVDLGFSVEPGALVAIAFVLPDGHRLELDGRVLHATELGRVGVKFESMDDERRSLLAALLRG